ncbi:MAG: hypothetical protein ACRDR6_07180 [Pseudonocardiaceae bacterium]
MSTVRRTGLTETVNQTMRIQVLRSVLLNQAIAARAGINPTDLQCLNLLTLEGPMTPSRLAEAMAMTKGGAITAMVDGWRRPATSGASATSKTGARFWSRSSGRSRCIG